MSYETQRYEIMTNKCSFMRFIVDSLCRQAMLDPDLKGSVGIVGSLGPLALFKICIHFKYIFPCVRQAGREMIPAIMDVYPAFLGPGVRRVYIRDPYRIALENNWAEP